MSPKRIRQRLADFTKALERLQEGLSEDPSLNSMIVDGTIQRFEFTFELAWKLGRDILEYNGVEAVNPRSVIKELFQGEMIQDGESWIQMLEDRNKTSHIYDEREAKAIYKKIKKDYYDLLDEFKKKILPMMAKIK